MPSSPGASSLALAAAAARPPLLLLLLPSPRSSATPPPLLMLRPPVPPLLRPPTTPKRPDSHPCEEPSASCALALAAEPPPWVGGVMTSCGEAGDLRSGVGAPEAAFEEAAGVPVRAGRPAAAAAAGVAVPPVLSPAVARPAGAVVAVEERPVPAGADAANRAAAAVASATTASASAKSEGARVEGSVAWVDASSEHVLPRGICLVAWCSSPPLPHCRRPSPASRRTSAGAQPTAMARETSLRVTALLPSLRREEGRGAGEWRVTNTYPPTL